MIFMNRRMTKQKNDNQLHADQINFYILILRMNINLLKSHNDNAKTLVFCSYCTQDLSESLEKLYDDQHSCVSGAKV